MSIPHPSKAAIFSSYRSCLRQIPLLPTEYLRQFFRIKIRDDVQTAVQREEPRSRKNAANRVSNTANMLRRANRGKAEAFTRILDLAYGRSGKLKWELKEPFLTDPNSPKPPRIIPNDPKSSPPVYSQPLQALLLEAKARINGKSLAESKLQYPTDYPQRGIPGTPERTIMGPLSKRRQKNLLWRAFVRESAKVHYPLEVVVSKRQTAEQVSDPAALAAQGVSPLGFQDQGLYDEVEAIAGFEPAVLTSRERKALKLPAHQPVPRLTLHPKSRLTERFIRRRFRQLIDRIPILKYSYDDGTSAKPPSYSVHVSPHALTAQHRYVKVKVNHATLEDLAWVEHTKKQRSS